MRFACLVAAVAMAAPGAWAQSGCALLDKVIADAPNGFASFRGEEIDDGWFDSKLYFTGAEECAVDVGKETTFSCVWVGDNSAAANTQTVALSESAKLCLKDWPAADLTGQISANGLKIEMGTLLTGAGQRAGVKLRVFAEAYETSPERNVWLEVLAPK